MQVYERLPTRKVLQGRQNRYDLRRNEQHSAEYHRQVYRTGIQYLKLIVYFRGTHKQVENKLFRISLSKFMLYIYKMCITAL